MADIAVQRVEDKSARPLPLFQEIEKQFEQVRKRAFELFQNRGSELGHALDDWLNAEHEIIGWPAAELSEADSKYEMSVTLPGYEPKDVQVTATPSEIVVHAKIEDEKKTEEGKRLWTEFKSNDVYRRFELPETIDVEKTTATLDKGMLHITSPKLSTAQEKTIQVQAA